jgi:hypothetical protein
MEMKDWQNNRDFIKRKPKIDSIVRNEFLKEYPTNII